MSIRFQRAERKEAWLLPPSVQDWLPQDHLARFVVEIVDTLDLDGIIGTYRHGGKPAYCPSMMVALLFHGYATGVHSSRKLEAATHDSVAVRFITGNLHPDHDTIARHCRRHLSALQDLFLQVLTIARTIVRLKSILTVSGRFVSDWISIRLVGSRNNPERLISLSRQLCSSISR